MSGVAAVALAGTGIYMMTSKETKKKACLTMHSAINDANKMVNKTMNNINTKNN